MLTRSVFIMKNKHLIDPMDFNLDQLNEIFKLSHQIITNPNKFSDICQGKILATLFYEPSTRTRFSFEAAMMRLGGKILGFSEPNSSSAAKGETLADTIKMVSIYSDIIAMRHPKEGSARVASMYSKVPVINAGDGGHQHPTQTLTDLLTIESLKKGLENHTLGICGDLKNGRTVHSLIKAMSRYKNNKFILISPKELAIPEYIREEILKKNNIEFKEVEKLEEVIEELDILYMTRIQKERFFNEEEYLRLKDSYILDMDKMNLAKEDMIVMHPLPRVNEIDIEVDNDKRAAYFKQAEYGMYVRMALIAKLLEVA
ncbi:aspartate carbamoyltransferase [Clostridium chauvoei]|nr:aspartate carbamoyltransferase [Clostridium chauvoei]ATD58671.1 aspartate carbamoyltransferase [Clostridium chauvoei]